MSNIVLCGSMKIKEKIFETKKDLENLVHNVLIPEECIAGLPKQVASRCHFDRIANPNNNDILIVNDTKNNIENYIGPNSFAEIALAFYFHKNIYLLNDIYEPYRDELIGWNVKTLKGNLYQI